MSDGLLQEVSALLGARLAVRAADQAFFGGKQVYTNIKPSTSSGAAPSAGSDDPLSSAINKAKQIAQNALGGASSDNSKVLGEVAALRKEVSGLKDDLSSIKSLLEKLSVGGASAPAKAAAAPAPAKAAAAPKEEKDDDEDFDLFDSDSDDEEKKKIVEERLKAYHAKKATKVGPIAKSSVIMDVKPWDDETNLEEMEANVRSIEQDGLVWGGGKKIPIGYGISKLQIICVIEDLKVSVDDLIEKIQDGFPDHVQSVDIVAFNKI